MIWTPKADGLSRVFSDLLGVLYPSKCPLCALLSEEVPCVTCRAEMTSAPIKAEFNLGQALDFRVVCYPYEGRSGQAVRRLKYSRATALVDFMSFELKQEKAAQNLDDYVVVPVPIHWSRLCERGFNQAELLCRAFPHESKMLTRIRATRPQVGLDREQRSRNLTGAFRSNASASGCKVLLVDDVVTSGQTAGECALTLKQAGAIEVGILAFCGEPL